MKRSSRILVVSLVLVTHFAIDAVLLLFNWAILDDWHMLLLAWPLSQGSLLAVWAAVSRTRAYLRFPAALLGLAWMWFVTVDLLVFGTTSPESATFASMFVAQALSIVLATMVGGLIHRHFERRRAGQTADRSESLQYGLGSLFVWTTIFAVMLGLGRMAFLLLGWTPEVVKHEYFIFAAGIGVCNAMYALLVLASLVGRRRLVLRILLSLVLGGMLALGENWLLEFVFGDDGGMSVKGCLILGVAQLVYLYATLLPLRLCGCFGVVIENRTPSQSGPPIQTAERGEWPGEGA